MSIEESKCNNGGESIDAVVTYKRRKRVRTAGESSSAQETAAVAVDDDDDDAALDATFGQGKSKDFGWEHGIMINGNRYHWECKWCHFVGRSGGVTRLKKHLAGGWQVSPCHKVPGHIAKAMNSHLIESKKRKSYRMKMKTENIATLNSKHGHLSTCVDGHNGLSILVTNEYQQFGNASKSGDTASQQSRDSFPGANFTTHELNTDMAEASDDLKKSDRTARCHKAAECLRVNNENLIANQQLETDLAEKVVKQHHDIMLCADTDEHGGVFCNDSPWRSVLEHMLQLPEICGGGGIGRSITDALTHGPPRDNKEPTMAIVPAELKDRLKSRFEVSDQTNKMDVSVNNVLDVPETETKHHGDAISDKQKFLDVFFNVLCSEKFISLCNLLYESFHGIRVDKLLDISQINVKMRNGVYEQSPGLFNQELQQMWRKFRKVGEELVLLADGLSNISQDIHQQVGEDLEQEACLQRCEENCQVDVETKNSNDSDTAIGIPFCDAAPSAKADDTDASRTPRVCACKQCGSDTDGEHILICDECEAVFHFSCIEPTVQELPRTWQCTFCTKEMILSPRSPLNDTQEVILHNNHMASERLEIPKTNENLKESERTTMANCFRESSASSMEPDEPLEPSQTALSRLCKQCGTCEDEDKRFLVCENNQCRYKFYHIRCLTVNQIASFQQAGQHCWYCPSCLCRACFRDRDDEMIVLCDNCDEAYHTYCMNPPRASIPKGHWNCMNCEVAKAKEVLKNYEQWILQQHGRKDAGQANGSSRSMDMLLSAVEKVSSEENMEG